MPLNTPDFASAHVCTGPAAGLDQTAYMAIHVPIEPIPLSARRYWAIDPDTQPTPRRPASSTRPASRCSRGSASGIRAPRTATSCP